MLRLFTSLAIASILFIQPLEAQELASHGQTVFASSSGVHATGPFKKVDLNDLSAHEANALQLTANNNLHIENLEVLALQNGKEITLSFVSPRTGTTTISVFNATGKRVFKERVKNLQGQYEGQIDLDGQNAGVYYLVLEQDRRHLSQKITL